MDELDRKLKSECGLNIWLFKSNVFLESSVEMESAIQTFLEEVRIAPLAI